MQRMTRCAVDSGFTLIEVMVAMTVATLLLAVAPLAYNKVYDAMSYQRLVQDMQSGLRGARIRAMLAGEEVQFLLDAGGQRFGQGGRTMKPLPSGVKLDAIVAESDPVDRKVGIIRFYPDGSATGGSVLLIRDTGQGVRLRVDWMLGRITQETLDVRG